MLKNNEKNLLAFIKYSPIVFVAILALVVNVLIHIQNDINFKKQIEQSKENFVNTKKLLVKNEVDKVFENIVLQREDIENKLKDNIKIKVYTAYEIVENLYENYKHLGDKKVLKIIKDALRNIRFNEGRGYYFIDGVSGVKHLQPINPKIEGGNYLEYRDSKGYQFVKTISNTIKNRTERFDEYYWPKPGDPTKSFKKISFYKTFAPLDIAIGAGEYLDDFTKNLQELLLYDYINKISFGSHGYVFVFDYNGKFLSHFNPVIIGENKLNYKDKNGKEIVKDMLSLAKNGGGYLKYTFPDTFKSEKTTYVKALKSWEWVIAAGFYDNELLETIKNKELELKEINQEYVKKIFIVSIIITLLLLFVTLSVSTMIKNSFVVYNEQIRRKNEEGREKDGILYQQSKMAAMGEMLANIAHQWRQPLSLITTVSTSIKLQRELEILDEKDADRGLDQIIKNAEYLSQTIDDFKHFFKPDKKSVLVSVPYLLNKTFMLLSSKLHDKNIQVIENIDDISIWALENEFVQVLINVINNAEDALTKVKGNKFIFIDSYCHNDHIHITIKDNAGGIDKDIIKRVFEPYFTTKHKSQGTGIGLYMAKEIIIRHMKGKVIVKNVSFEHNKKQYFGAEFDIILPLKNNVEN